MNFVFFLCKNSVTQNISKHWVFLLFISNSISPKVMCNSLVSETSETFIKIQRLESYHRSAEHNSQHRPKICVFLSF